MKKEIRLSNAKKNALKKVSTWVPNKSNNYKSINSNLVNLDKNEKKLKEINKNNQIKNDKKENLEKKYSHIKKFDSLIAILPGDFDEDSDE